MPHYLLSVHVEADKPREPMTDEDMQRFMREIGSLEEEMKARGAWVFSARLHGPDTATVVRVADGEVLTTDGPYAESKEHMGGFYIVDAPDLDGALDWGAKVTAVVGRPIEVRPFADTAS